MIHIDNTKVEITGGDSPSFIAKNSQLIVTLDTNRALSANLTANPINGEVVDGKLPVTKDIAAGALATVTAFKVTYTGPAAQFNMDSMPAAEDLNTDYASYTVKAAPSVYNDYYFVGWNIDGGDTLYKPGDVIAAGTLTGATEFTAVYLAKTAGAGTNAIDATSDLKTQAKLLDPATNGTSAMFTAGLVKAVINGASEVTDEGGAGTVAADKLTFAGFDDTTPLTGFGATNDYVKLVVTATYTGAGSRTQTFEVTYVDPT